MEFNKVRIWLSGQWTGHPPQLFCILSNRVAFWNWISFYLEQLTGSVMVVYLLPTEDQIDCFIYLSSLFVDVDSIKWLKLGNKWSLKFCKKNDKFTFNSWLRERGNMMLSQPQRCLFTLDLAKEWNYAFSPAPHRHTCTKGKINNDKLSSWLLRSYSYLLWPIGRKMCT